MALTKVPTFPMTYLSITKDCPNIVMAGGNPLRLPETNDQVSMI